MFASRIHGLEADLAFVQDQCAQDKILTSAKPGALQREKKGLSEKIETLHKFLDTRILWTAYTRDIATRLPASITLRQFQGVCAMPMGKGDGGQAAKRSLLMQAQSTLASDGSVPREVGEFFVSLPKHPLYRRDFPDVLVTNIRPAQASKRVAGSASFAVVCQPAVAKKGGSGSEKKE
jgi:hypothetical protein